MEISAVSKGTSTEMKTSLEAQQCFWMGRRVGALEDKLIKIIQSKEQRGKEDEK